MLHLRPQRTWIAQNEFVEKATEIGIDALTPILTRHSERKEIKPARIEKILVRQ